MNLDDCIEKGLIKKSSIEKDKITGEINQAEHYLKRAKGNFEMNYYDVSYMLSYTSMFHSAKTLLFKKGFVERSHFCLIELLKKEFSENNELMRFLELLDIHRKTRHAILYSGNLCSEEKAQFALNDAEELFEFITALIN